ncbi:MAG: preprotein translocase subunit SecG [Candidatus Saccharimonadales bacterium]
MSIYNYITIITTIILTILILVQTRGASLGAGLGGSGEVNMTRRGSDKTLYQLTIITALIFTASLIIGLLTTH